MMATKHALIVEDASNWVKQHQLSLGELGFKTSAANNYAEALGLLRRDHFDVAVIDLCLTTDAEPENLDGVFLLDYLVEKNIPVIIVTGRGYRQLVDEIYRGFDVFEILDKLHFNPEKFKQYVVQATSAKPESASANEQKRAISREKIENLILTLMRSAPAQPRQLDSPLPTAPKAQHKRLRVFISHSNKDKPLVDKLANDLQAAGLDLWYDRDEIQVGDTILEKIGQGLANCDYMIIILSPDAVDSWMVRQELLIFLNEEMRRGHRLVLPVLYKDCQIPLLLDGRRYADFRENYDAGITELLNSLGIGKRTIERTATK
jgi:CheY-like chemotaxis protein